MAVEGLDLYFNSSDHLPPHFHAERPGKWEVRVFFLAAQRDMVEVKWARVQPSSRALRRLCAAAAESRATLLVEWERKVRFAAEGEE